MKRIFLMALVVSARVHMAFAQTKTVTVDANDALNSNTKIVAQTSVGQVFFTGHQLGSTYAFPSAGIFRAWTDNPTGTSNYYYDGVTNGNVNFSVRADGQGYFAGKVGINTTTPAMSLDVNGALLGGNTNLDGVNTNFLANSSKVLIGWNRTAGAGETDFISNQGAGNTGGFAFYNHNNSNTENLLMWLTGDGRLQLGQFTTSMGTNKLAVAGGIIAESVTVKLKSAWPDYVFKPTYQLPSLSEVKTYIDQNQHLPEIPSEKEIANEGQNLGEMNKLLLKKVEELTLYLIEQNKRIEKLESQINKSHE
ncbi:hypothetical protein ACFJIV_14280 [Mucilaginibacter sp. UC70_90]